MAQEIIDKWPRSKAAKIRTIIGRLDLCGCGTNAHWEIVLKLLEMAEDHDKNGSFYGPDGSELATWIEFGAKVLDSWDLTEHGTGIGGAWLTDEGKLLLEFLRDFGTEDHDMNDNSGQPVWATEFSWTETPKDDDWYSEWTREARNARSSTEGE